MTTPHATIEDAVKKAAAVVSYESVGHVTFDRAEAVILSELAPFVAEREAVAIDVIRLGGNRINGKLMAAFYAHDGCPTFLEPEECTRRRIACAAQMKAMRIALHKIAYEPIGEADASAVQVYDDIVQIARDALAGRSKPNEKA